MRDIESVLIVGAGAVGSVVAGTIDEALPGTVSILADAERAPRYRAEGFSINGRRRSFRIVEATGKSEPDLVLVAVKNHQLPRAAGDLARHVGPSTQILSLMNGISSEETLAAAFGWDRVLYAMILGIDAVREGGATRYTTAGKIHFGEARNPPGGHSERVSRIATFFGRAGVGFVVPEDMVRSLWFKFMINVGVNQGSAVLRAPYGAFQRPGAARQLMEAAMREVVALSKAAGTGLRDEDVAAWGGTLASLAPDGKTSMLQDVEARRKTEVELFAGAVAELGRARAVQTPVNETLGLVIKAIEEGYAASAPTRARD